MKLKDIVAISGKPGLHKIVTKTNKGIIVESLDEHRRKFPVRASFQVAMLEEITIYTEDDSSLPLKDVLKAMWEKSGAVPEITPKDSSGKIREYFREVAPHHDEDRVYISDLKKVLKWYDILVEADVINEENVNAPDEEEEEENQTEANS